MLGQFVKDNMGKLAIFVAHPIKKKIIWYFYHILNNQLLPWATEHYENGHWILQQDGAFAHLAKSTQYWCLANLPDASERPANSPELSVLDFSI
ncbi:hypothetical protein ANCDUO_12630 [Ancylostoma duodenale]|uniref:Uncharacterized protein n=1 Tax=Ancylostoma duodenale TaxID=51022 RepID=A0A0C2GJC3_9BILA|nr:hypothetical protein ANCDUO_12630 [Ancylostoma duodenale]